MNFWEKISDKTTKISYTALRFAMLILCGVLTGLTLVFPQIGLLEWFTLIFVGVILLVRASDTKIRLRSLYLDGLVYFYAFYLTCFHWFVYIYPLDFIDGMTKGGALAVILAGWWGLSLFQALLSSFAFVVIGVVFRTALCKKITYLKPFAAAGIWAVFEWGQTIGWWGVPWGRLPIGQTEYLWGLQNASLFGSYFVTFVLVAVNFLLAAVLLHPLRVKIGILCAALLIVFQYGSGALLWYLNDVTEGEKIKVACVQGNISSAEKWDSTSLERTLDNYQRLTAEAAERGAELVIWPETAFPYDLSQGNYSIYSEYFAALADKYNVYIFVGAFVTDDSDNFLNSLICYTPDGERLDDVYAKRRLVPFGEYVPMKLVIQTFIPPLAELVLSEGELYAGEGSQIIELENGTKIGGLICFDSIYEDLTLESVRDGAELICLSTNDSWFIDSRALYMHNAQAQIRAVESGRYIARAANTGISTVINSRGEVLGQLPPLVDDVLVDDVYATDRDTLWSFIGNGFVYLLIIGEISVIIADFVCKIKKKHNKKQLSA